METLLEAIACDNMSCNAVLQITRNQKLNSVDNTSLGKIFVNFFLLTNQSESKQKGKNRKKTANLAGVR